MIAARGLAKRFGAVSAVGDVSFDAADGHITGLLGPNGAGKTTTLRMLYTLIAPDRGSVHVDHVDAVADPVAARGRLGVLPDGRGLYQRLTARENIEYFARLNGLDRVQSRHHADALIRELEMEGYADRPTAGFSTGQRVKTALARALVHRPQNIVLDEPTNGLDVMATRALRAFLLAARDQGRCIVFSSHVMQEVAALCDRIVVMGQGRVVASGTVDELRELAGATSLEDAFVRLIGSAEGLHA